MKELAVFARLAEVLNAPQSRYLPRIFAQLITPEEGEMILQLPASAEELAHKLSQDHQAVTQKLEELTRKGLTIPRTREGSTRYFFMRSVLQFHDSSGVYEAAGAEFQDLWRQWRETEAYELYRQWEQMSIPITRVFPFPGAVKEDSELLVNEDLRAIVSRAREIAVVKCVCRLVMKKCRKPLEVCLTFDAAAEFALHRGVGRKLSQDEAWHLFQICGEEGMVPTNLNSARVTAMCFCCPDCCIFLQPYRDYGYRLLAPSRYEATVEPELCNGCQECVERCQFGAIEMRKYGSGKKLKAVIQAEKCYGCGVCVVGCAPQALSLKLVRPPEHIPEVGARY
jgi:ferredoxin/DNA-binding transcriptional ArsR family regulator